jgi:hypothetical protein
MNNVLKFEHENLKSVLDTFIRGMGELKFLYKGNAPKFN